ncbi:hypothetical protein [Seohaeicola sp.]|uniref:hypothetical protein n=1 Tax=Seohaeicola sp. TaxID=2042026 RepID=UPI003A885FE4
MIQLLFLVLAFFLVATGVSAQTLTLRSGEHDGYTRLTASLLPQAEWRIDTREDKLLLSLSMPMQAIETAAVFQRIERDRIRRIIPRDDARGLEVLLGCDCGFRVFRHSETLLVIDIGEALPKQDAVGSLRMDPVYDDVESLKAGRVGEESDSAEFLGLPLFPPKPAPDLTATPQVVRVWPQAGFLSAALSQASPRPEQRATELSPLMEEIDRATRQGLLQPAPDLPAIRTEGATVPDLSSFPNLRTRAASELSRVAPDLAEQLEPDLTCVQRDDLDIASWGHVDGFSTGIAVWRTQLAKDMDRVDLDAVLGLARHYLHYGFGAEAIATLAMAKVSTEKTDLLLSLARIIDHGHDSENGVLSGMTKCQGPVALWSLLSDQDPPRTLDLNMSELRFAFEELPSHLKEQLGPGLVERLSAAGENAAAEEVLASITRSLGQVTPPVALATAAVELENGNTEGAEDHLEALVETNTAISPQALVTFIESAVQADQPIEPEMVELVSAHLFENRRSPLAADLSRSLILALAHAGEFAEALDRLKMKSNDLPADNASVTASRVMSRLVSHGSDVDFLAGTVTWQLMALAPETENRIATRLLSLGFPEIANRFLTRAAEGNEGRERRLLRAKAALALDQPLQAEAELLGLSGQDVKLLRAEAQQRGGDFEAALDEIEGLELEEKHRSLAWLAGDWTTLMASDDDVLSQAARLMIDDGSTLETASPDALQNEETGVLRKTGDLITASGNSRMIIESLLQRFQLDTQQ